LITPAQLTEGRSDAELLRMAIHPAIERADTVVLRVVATQLGLTPRTHSEDAGRPYVAPVDRDHDI
jgi:phage terminase small subunit